jgi:hypothetical protein
MDKNLNQIATELYGTLQTSFPDIKIGDEAGEVLSKKSDIPLARFFEFPYKENGKTLGTLTITLDQDDGIIVQVGGDLVDSDVPGIFKFITKMSRFASKRLLNYKIINLEKSNLDKRDYEFQAKRKELPAMPPVSPVMESKFYGTSKLSYQDLGEARIVIKHSQPVNPEVAAGRTMHIESIYVENSQGERFKYPFKHINGARALAEHLKHGGNPYDPIGKHITSMSEELAQLRKFKGYVGRNEALAEAMGDIQGRVMERIEEIKEQVNKLQRKAYYETFAESFEEHAAQEIPEAVMDDWIDRLTVRTFNEDLKTAFPYIFKLVDESSIPVKELSPEDMLSELSKDTLSSYTKKAADNLNDKAYSAGHAHARGREAHASKNDATAYKRLGGINKAVDRLTKEEAAFESFIDSIMEDSESQDGVDTLFSPNRAVQQAAIEKLNQLMAADLTSGGNAINAKLSLKGLIDDPEFIQSLDQVDPDLDVRVLVQQYVQQRDPEVAMQLDFGDAAVGGEEPAPAPEEIAPAPEAPLAEVPPEAGAVPPAPEAAPGAVPPVPGEEEIPPAVPVAESMDNTKLRAKFIKAQECGAGLDTEMDFGHKTMTLLDAIREAGLTPMECGFEEPEEENEIDNESGMDQILKSIAGFWNKEERNFTIGGTRVKTKIVKGFKDGEYPNATEEDVKMVLQKVEQMDPSSSEHEDVMKLAGVPQAVEVEIVDHRPGVMSEKLGKMSPMESVTFATEDSLARIIQLSR